MEYYNKKEINKNYHESANASTLSKLDAILNKPNSLRVICKNEPDNIKSDSYMKICQMSGKPDDSQLNYTYMDGPESKEIKKKEKQIENKPRLFKYFDNNILEQMHKNGTNVSKNINCLLCLTKSFYYLLICLGICILVFLGFHIYKNYFTLSIGEFITICLISFCFLNGTMGISKYSKRSVAKFDKINTLLFMQILSSGFFFTMTYTTVFAGEHMIHYCQQNFIFMILFSVISASLSFMLIIFNTLICGFYEDYSKTESDVKLTGEQLLEIK